MAHNEHPDRTADGSDSTSFHVRRAGEGMAESLAWIVARFTPLLRAQADYRLRGRLRRFVEPDDLVGEVWAVVLPRIRELRPREDHWTPVLLKFLSTTLLHKLNHVMTSYARIARKPEQLPPVTGTNPVSKLPAEVTSALTHAARDEASHRLHEALDRLEPEEREVLVLRGIEQLPHAEVARLLGATTGAVTMRYHRTLEKLRASLTGSLLDELPAE
jgi:RNA polymerase sigma-70 factor (ECF subfamily)